MSKTRRTAASLLQQISESGPESEQATSPFGVLGDLVRKNAATVLDPGYCDALVERLMKTGKSTLDTIQARNLLQVSDLGALSLHPYFIRARSTGGRLLH